MIGKDIIEIVGNMDMRLKVGDYTLALTLDIIEVKFEYFRQLHKTQIKLSFDDNEIVVWVNKRVIP